MATLYLLGESPTYILNEDTQPVMRAIRESHTACKIYDLTAGVYFKFYNNIMHILLFGLLNLN